MPIGDQAERFDIQIPVRRRRAPGRSRNPDTDPSDLQRTVHGPDSGKHLLPMAGGGDAG